MTRITTYKLKLHSHSTAQDSILPRIWECLELAREGRLVAIKLLPDYQVSIVKVSTFTIESTVE